MHAGTGTTTADTLQQGRGLVVQLQNWRTDQTAHIVHADAEERRVDLQQLAAVGLLRHGQVEPAGELAAQFVHAHVVQPAMAHIRHYAADQLQRPGKEYPLSLLVVDKRVQHPVFVAVRRLHFDQIRHDQQWADQRLWPGIAFGDRSNCLLPVCLPLGDGAADHAERNQDRRNQQRDDDGFEQQRAMHGGVRGWVAST